jgi:hypothetical protein
MAVVTVAPTASAVPASPVVSVAPTAPVADVAQASDMSTGAPVFPVEAPAPSATDAAPGPAVATQDPVAVPDEVRTVIAQAAQGVTADDRAWLVGQFARAHLMTHEARVLALQAMFPMMSSSAAKGTADMLLDVPVHELHHMVTRLSDEDVARTMQVIEQSRKG